MPNLKSSTLAVETAPDLYSRVRSADKKLIIYPAGQPGCTHCQVDALALLHRDVCDWIEDHVR